MKKNKISILILVAFSIILSSCDSCEKEKISGEAIENADDAETAAYQITDLVGGAVTPHYADAVWNNEVVQGYYSGTATVNGSFEEESDYRYYNNVSITCDNYSNEDYQSKLTGTATLNGRINVTSYNYYNSYSGAWYFKGNMKLTDKFHDEVSFNITYWEPNNNWSGSITCSSGTYTVSFYKK